MRAKAPTPAGQPTQIVGSPAEPPNDVIVMPNDPDADPPEEPIQLPDERVFLAASTPLTITGIGEAEFSNFFNPMDVNGDFSVSPIDAVLVINELNAGGSQALSPMTFAAKGFARPTNLLDVNMDSFLAPIDAVLVINHLNAQSQFLRQASSLGEGEGAADTTLPAGEGEADGEFAGATAGADEALLTALLMSASDEQSPASAADNNASESPEDQILQVTATGGISPVVNEEPAPLFRSRFVNVDTDAADEVFATFASSQQSAPSSRFSFGNRLSTKSRFLR
jgi:hypothetical protein